MVARNALSLTKAADTGLYNLAVGECITLTLDENPTTGFRWQIEAGSGLEVTSSEYLPTAGGAAGCGGFRTIKLLGRAPGVHRVRAQLLRAWIGTGSAIDRCEFIIKVLPPHDNQESGDGIG
jgi:inhibitor of cysteine peptidase